MKIDIILHNQNYGYPGVSNGIEGIVNYVLGKYNVINSSIKYRIEIVFFDEDKDEIVVRKSPKRLTIVLHKKIVLVNNPRTNNDWGSFIPIFEEVYNLLSNNQLADMIHVSNLKLSKKFLMEKIVNYYEWQLPLNVVFKGTLRNKKRIRLFYTPKIDSFYFFICPELENDECPNSSKVIFFHGIPGLVYSGYSFYKYSYEDDKVIVSDNLGLIKVEISVKTKEVKWRIPNKSFDYHFDTLLGLQSKTCEDQYDFRNGIVKYD
ncbi:MAG: hypothetical protein EP332_08905 [Bacteroidetes bacterium]|nr:MAG: hypothetical protein EP332_08905 [Bacteroidota bacterium]